MGWRRLDAASPASDFADGAFRGLPVTLGHAKLQADGSLIFTGGSGISKSRKTNGEAAALTNFADNDDWFDDTCEGPVKAEIHLPGGSVKQALGARVVVAPDFAPEISPWVTLYDIAYQAAIDKGFLHADATPPSAFVFFPSLRRALASLRNERAGSGHSGGAPGNFASKFAQLANPASPKAIRQRIFDRF